MRASNASSRPPASPLWRSDARAPRTVPRPAASPSRHEGKALVDRRGLPSADASGSSTRLSDAHRDLRRHPGRRRGGQGVRPPGHRGARRVRRLGPRRMGTSALRPIDRCVGRDGARRTGRRRHLHLGRGAPDASGARALLEGLGYSPEREYLHMGIDVPDGFDPGGAPAGITVRPRVETDDRAIVAVMADAFEDPWDYEEARQELLGPKTTTRRSGSSPSTGTRRSERCSGTSRTGAARSAPSVSVPRGVVAASPARSCARRSRCSGSEALPT